jgi:prolyl oligopeptidase
MVPIPWTKSSYPPARRSDHVDIYKSAAKGEVRVSDPYQWLEADTEETDKWTSAQEAFTRTHLDKNADRQKLEDAFRASMDYAKVPELIDSTLCLKAHHDSVLIPYFIRRWPLVLVL